MSMSDEDFKALEDSDKGCDLDGLEASIWERIALDGQLARTRSTMIGWQAGLVCFFLAVGIASTYFEQATRTSPLMELDAFSPAATNAPSTLLLGSHS